VTAGSACDFAVLRSIVCGADVYLINFICLHSFINRELVVGSALIPEVPSRPRIYLKFDAIGYEIRSSFSNKKIGEHQVTDKTHFVHCGIL
jgi:hypothetical protein